MLFGWCRVFPTYFAMHPTPPLGDGGGVGLGSNGIGSPPPPLAPAWKTLWGSMLPITAHVKIILYQHNLTQTQFVIEHMMGRNPPNHPPTPTKKFELNNNMSWDWKFLLTSMGGRVGVSRVRRHGSTCLQSHIQISPPTSTRTYSKWLWHNSK